MKHLKLLMLMALILTASFDCFGQEDASRIELSIVKENNKGLWFRILNDGQFELELPNLFQPMKKQAYVLEFGENQADTFFVDFSKRGWQFSDGGNSVGRIDGAIKMINLQPNESIQIFWPRRLIPSQITTLEVSIPPTSKAYLKVQ